MEQPRPLTRHIDFVEELVNDIMNDVEVVYVEPEKPKGLPPEDFHWDVV